MSEPIISIISPTFNVRPWIEEFLQAVADQRCDRIEHIIVDGASTDGTVEIIKNFAARHPYIRWISEKDESSGEALNKGIVLARAPYLGILPVNDFYEPGILNRVISILPARPGLEFWVGNCNILNGQDELQYVNKPTALKPWLIMRNQPFPYNPVAYFYAKNIHDRIGLYETQRDRVFDLAFLLKAFTVANPRYIDEAWGNFREMPTSITTRWKKENVLEQFKQDTYRRFMAELSWPRRLYYRFRMALDAGAEFFRSAGRRMNPYLRDPRNVERFFRRRVLKRS